MAEKAPLVRTRLAEQGITAVDETIAKELQAQGWDVDRTVELLVQLAGNAAAEKAAADVQKQADDGVACHFYFLRSSDILAFAGKSLPAFQTIMADHPGWIVRRRCTFEDALLGTYKSSRLAVSQYAPSPPTRVALGAAADLIVNLGCHAVGGRHLAIPTLRAPSSLPSKATWKRTRTSSLSGSTSPACLRARTKPTRRRASSARC